KSPATTTNATAKQNLIRVFPKTLPMCRSPSETASFTKRKILWMARTMRETHIARAVNLLTLARLLGCFATKKDATLAREYPVGKAGRDRRCVESVCSY